MAIRRILFLWPALVIAQSASAQIANCVGNFDSSGGWLNIAPATPNTSDVFAISVGWLSARPLDGFPAEVQIHGNVIDVNAPGIRVSQGVPPGMWPCLTAFAGPLAAGAYTVNYYSSEITSIPPAEATVLVASRALTIVAAPAAVNATVIDTTSRTTLVALALLICAFVRRSLRAPTGRRRDFQDAH